MGSYRDDVTDDEAAEARLEARAAEDLDERGWTYMDVLGASTPGEVTEASLGRVWQHLESGDPWGIISAWKGAYEDLPEEQLQQVKTQNNRRSERLESDLSSMGYGYIPMRGRWKTTDDEGETRWVQERSFFVPKIERDDIVALANRYDQEGVVFGEPGDNGDVVLLESDGSVMFTIGPNEGDALRPRKVADNYSRVKGHAFVLGDADVSRDPALDESAGEGLRHFHFEGVAHSHAEATARDAGGRGHGDLHDRIDEFIDGVDAEV